MTTPFRTAVDRPIQHSAPGRLTAPELLAFAQDELSYRVIVQDVFGVHFVRVDRRQGVLVARATLSTTSEACTAAIGFHGWACFAREGGALVSYAGTTDGGAAFERRALPGAPDGGFAAMLLDGEPCVACAFFGDGRGAPAELRVFDQALRAREDKKYVLDPTSRVLVAATVTVWGPALVFTTDRSEEVNFCVPEGDDTRVRRTVSLGRNQRFDRALGGGTRIAVLSRGEQDVVVRTVASDVRTELNPVPFRARDGHALGVAACAYSSGNFLLAFVDQGAEQAHVVVANFDGKSAPIARVPLPGLGAVVLEGKDLTLATVTGGCAVPLLYLHRMTLEGARHRRYCLPLASAAPDTPERRRGLLADFAELLCQSLGSASPEDLVLESQDEGGDVASFRVPAAEGALAISALITAEEGAIVTVRLGDRRAPPPRPLRLLERFKMAFTGDDDDDPRTLRVELPELIHGVEQVLQGIGGLRAALREPQDG